MRPNVAILRHLGVIGFFHEIYLLLGTFWAKFFFTGGNFFVAPYLLLGAFSLLLSTKDFQEKRKKIPIQFSSTISLPKLLGLCCRKTELRTTDLLPFDFSGTAQD